MKLKTKNYYLAIILLFVSNIFMVTLLFLNSLMADAAISGKMKLFIIAVIAEMISMLVVSLINYLTKQQQNKYKYQYAISLRNRFFNNVIKKESISKDDTEKAAIARMTNDVEYIIENDVNQNFIKINALMGVIFPLLGSAIVHFSFILVFPISALIAFAIVGKSSSKIENLSAQRSESYSKFINIITELFNGFQTFKMYNAYKMIETKLGQSQEEMENTRYKLGNKISYFESLIMVGMVVSQLFYAVNAAILVFYRQITPGSIVGLMGMAQSFFGNMNGFVQTSLYIKSVKPIIEKMMSINESEEQRTLEKISDKISVDKLSFSFGDKAIFSDFSCDFEIGKKYLIRGKSGAGKSTLLKLLSKQIDNYTGNIYYDGVELKNLSDDTIKSQIAYIAQDVFIMSDTIRNNITLGDDVDEDRLNYSMSLSNLKELEGRNEIIDDKTISGGQKQRIAIARALYYGKTILLIDEAIKGLDEESAGIVENNLLGLKDMTIIMISHNEIKDKNAYDGIVNV